MVGYGLLILATMGWVPQFFSFRSGASAEAPPPGPAPAQRGRDRAAFAAAPPPAITISIEPETHGARSESKSPVDFPGILLPPDGSEEPAHAGS